MQEPELAAVDHLVHAVASASAELQACPVLLTQARAPGTAVGKGIAGLVNKLVGTLAELGKLERAARDRWRQLIDA